jgi:hypothetical protein
MLQKFFLYSLLLSVFGKATACGPLLERYWAETPERVKANFDEAKFVVVADVIKVTIKPAKILPGEIEVATFRVKHSFKGSLKRGNTFIVETGNTSCARGVLDDTWRVSTPPPPGKSLLREPKLLNPPREWLLYYTPASHGIPFEIEVNPRTRPVRDTAYDLDILQRYSRQWK